MKDSDGRLAIELFFHPGPVKLQAACCLMISVSRLADVGVFCDASVHLSMDGCKANERSSIIIIINLKVTVAIVVFKLFAIDHRPRHHASRHHV